MSQHIQDVLKHGVDGVAGVVTVGAMMEFLPPLAAAFTIVWTGLRVYILIEAKIKTGKWQ